jgi:hypothetical protein
MIRSGFALKVGDSDPLRQQAERMKGVGDALLACDHLAVDRQDPVGLTLERNREHRCRQPDRRTQLLGHGIDVVLGPIIGLVEGFEHDVRSPRIAGQEFSRRKIELIIGDETGAVGEDARAGGGFSGGLIGIPDHPCIDQAAREGSKRVGGRQEYGLDIAVFQPGLFQRPHQQIVDVRALVQRDLLAAKISHRFQRTVLRHQDGLASRGRRIVGEIDQRRAGGLRKDRRRLARNAEIDGADIEGFEQRGPGWKFRPGHAVAERLELVLECTPALEQDELAVFLVADADDLVLAITRADRCSDCAERQHGSRDHSLKPTHDFPPKSS